MRDITLQTDTTYCLMAYGLTLNQAKIYLAIIQNNADTIKKISFSSGLPLESIYRSMPSLLRMQLIEKEFTTPSKFKALPPTQAFKLLKARDKKERGELYRQTDSIAEELILTKPTDQYNHDSDTALIYSYEAFVRKLGLGLQRMKNTFQGITNINNFRIGMSNNGKFYEKSLKKGIKCYHIIQTFNDLKSSSLGDDHLIKNESWKRRFTSESAVEYAIIDKKELFMSLSVPQQGKKHRAIFTTNTCLLAMAIKYFDALWISANEFP